MGWSIACTFSISGRLGRKIFVKLIPVFQTRPPWPADVSLGTPSNYDFASPIQSDGVPHNDMLSPPPPPPPPPPPQAQSSTLSNSSSVAASPKQPEPPRMKPTTEASSLFVSKQAQPERTSIAMDPILLALADFAPKQSQEKKNEPNERFPLMNGNKAATQTEKGSGEKCEQETVKTKQKPSEASSEKNSGPRESDKERGTSLKKTLGGNNATPKENERGKEKRLKEEVGKLTGGDCSTFKKESKGAKTESKETNEKIAKDRKVQEKDARTKSADGKVHKGKSAGNKTKDGWTVKATNRISSRKSNDAKNSSGKKVKGVTKRTATWSDEENGKKENNRNLKKKVQEDGDAVAADDRQQVGSSAVDQGSDVKMEDLSEFFTRNDGESPNAACSRSVLTSVKEEFAIKYEGTIQTTKGSGTTKQSSKKALLKDDDTRNIRSEGRRRWKELLPKISEKNTLEYLAKTYPHLPVKVGALLNKQIVHTTTIAEYYERAMETCHHGTYRYGPLHALSIVGTKQEECGDYFKASMFDFYCPAM
uniref:Uncharacterized protein n=1 Tax=Parascaris equorum TaxID=6256 RepID=A0A914RGP8_PAREQ